MKIVVIGTRGIPDIQGGVETHCQQLYPRLVRLGCEVTVMRRRCYVTADNDVNEYQGVHIVDGGWLAPSALGTAVHTLSVAFKVRRMHPDLVHLHAVGPSIVLPLLRLLGLKVVATHHGPDYNRAKWGWFAKSVIRFGEWCQVHMARHIIAISQEVVGVLAKRGRTQQVTYIPNGVLIPKHDGQTDYIEQLGLTAQRYVLAVGRFVPEKEFHTLIEAFEQMPHSDIRLVIAGKPDQASPYSQQLLERASKAGVVMPGFVTGRKLQQLYEHAALFVLPSSHEGLPIVLLEAMSHGVDVLVSDIAANRLPELNDDDFFAVGDVESLRQALERKLESTLPRKYDLSAYDWDQIAQRTLEVYQQAVSDMNGK